MKRLILLPIFLITFFFVQGNPDTLVSLNLDSVDLERLVQSIDSIGAKFDKSDNVGDLIKEGPSIINYSIDTKNRLVHIVKNMPAPNSKEAIQDWVTLIKTLWLEFTALLTFVVGWLFKVIRKDPKMVKTALGKAMNWVKMRWFVPTVVGIMTMVGLIWFQYGEGMQWWQILLSVIGSTIMAFGFDNILKLFSGFFDRDNKPIPEQKGA